MTLRLPEHWAQALCFFMQGREQVRMSQPGHLYLGVKTWQMPHSEVSSGSTMFVADADAEF